jgi:cell division protein ZapE
MTPAQLYAERIEKGLIKPDPAQADVVRVLDEVAANLSLPRNRGGEIKRGGFSALLKSVFVRTAPSPNLSPNKLGERKLGVYIYGPVGRGKSMLMDLLFECVEVPKKRRVHFHAFMQELHHHLHLGLQTKQTKSTDDALIGFARLVAKNAQLLCFDEFHVVDVADAMLLGRLFHALWQFGVVTVATSNWAPDTLYQDGLQRDRFLPFIAELKSRLIICHLQSDTDYRLARLRGFPVYYAPLGPHAAQQMEFLFQDLTQGIEPHVLELQLPGRIWRIPRAAKGIVWLEYQDACAEARGAPDYLALADAAQVVFLSGMPKFTEDTRNEVKRLMMLIDILYERHIRVVISAEAQPQQLYPAGRHGFEFERTVSRLMEMQSMAYLGSVIGAER